MRRLVAALLVALSTGAAAVELQCVENPDTLRQLCYVPGKVTVNGDLRASPLFMGGRHEVNPTAFTIVVNCRSSVATLQDRTGANVQAGATDATAVMRTMAAEMCALPKPRPDKTLRQ